jgi:hypothetical protein
MADPTATDPRDPGSDEQMGPERLDEIQHKLDLEEADMVEEERRTAAAPTTPTPDDTETRE